ncbi:MAG: bifunctional demethylmenaquinone methyltransferase/2-methoxy-6-polyprenyl-1,4-benzoquinol methylase UbiE [Spirochaetales bacterium]|nr:bifunctional demethylmenaquinone methyltransferase/2-methoxy-6-polyprenyl-1,4-benzoquinol methylase UbiE [Spirochaetales bacterium]
MKKDVNVHEIFSAIANQYDRLNTILSFGTDRLWRHQAIKLCELKPEAKVLDLCCGTGMMITSLCKKVGPQTQVVGLDFNAKMLAVAEKRLAAQPMRFNYRLVEGNVLDLPFPQASFDCVTIAFGLRNVPGTADALSQIYGVLKPGGRLVCLELSNPEMPVFKNVYSVYFTHFLPVLGYLGTGNKQAYSYLRDSVKRFLSKTELQQAFDQAGFEGTFFKPLTGGIAAIHVGIKPPIQPQ